MKSTAMTVLFWLVGLTAWPAGAQVMEMEKPGYTLSVAGSAQIEQQVESGLQTVATVSHEGQRIHIRATDDRLTVNFPKSTLRLQRRIVDSAGETETTIDFGGQRYVVREGRREIRWKLGSQDVFFRTRAGKVLQAVGSQDYLKLRRDTPSGRLIVESEAGTTDLSLVKGAIEVFDGPEIDRHLYFVRGLAFQQGPIRLVLPLPGDTFLDALPPERYLRIVHTPDPSPAPVNQSAETGAEQDKRDPLQADPSSWDSPVYRANLGDDKEDPLRARREYRPERKADPLGAKGQDSDSEEVLRVKDY